MKTLCTKILNYEDLEKFRNAIKKNYMIEYSIGFLLSISIRFHSDDSITFAEPIGYYLDNSYFLKTHLNLTIYYKEDFSVIFFIIYKNQTGLNYIDFISINLPKDETEVLIDKHYENLSD